MIPIVGVFNARSDAEVAARELRLSGISDQRFTILTPDSSEKAMASVPTTGGEQPGMFKTLGAVAGGAAGAGLGTGVVSLFLPGIGPILAIGMAGGALLGAFIGEQMGKGAENSVFAGLPHEELFVYEDALRQGRTVAVVAAADQSQADTARRILTQAGADSIDRAREMWWIGLRDVEKEHYESGHHGDFVEDEQEFRRGFEAAIKADRVKAQTNQSQPPEVPTHNGAFRKGYERGRTYLEEHSKRGK